MRFSTVLFLLAIWGVIHAAAVRAPANAASTSSQVNLKRAHHRKPPAKTEEDAHCKCDDNIFGAVEQKVLDDHKPTAKPTSLGKKPHNAPDKEAPHVKPTRKAPNKDVPHHKPSPKPSATHSKKPSAKPTTHKQSPTKAAPKAVTVTPKPITLGAAMVNGPIKTFTDTTFVTETAQITVTTIQTGLGKRDDTIDAPAPTTTADADSSDDDVTDPGALAFEDGFPDPDIDGTDDDDNESGDNDGTLNHRDVEYDDEETSTAYQEMLEGEMVDDNAAGNQKRDVDYDEEETSLAYQESLEAEMFEANHPLNTKAKRNDAGINTWPAPPLEDEEDDSDLLAKRGSVMFGLSKVASQFETHAFKDTFQKRDLDSEIARMMQEIEAHGGFIEKRNPEHHVDSKGRPCKGMHCAMEHNGHHWTAGQGFMPHDHRRDLLIVDDEELFLTDEDISKRNAEAKNNHPDDLLTDGDDDKISNRNGQPSYHTKQHGHEKPCTGYSMRCALANKGY